MNFIMDFIVKDKKDTMITKEVINTLFKDFY
jgi:hypothetical protein